jgi:hypothetical protein
MLNSYTTKNIKAFNQKKSIETDTLIKNLFLFSMFVVFAFVSPELLAGKVGGLLAEQTTAVISWVNGPIAWGVIGGGILYIFINAAMKSCIKTLLVGFASVGFVGLMYTWTDTAYAALI